MNYTRLANLERELDFLKYHQPGYAGTHLESWFEERISELTDQIERLKASATCRDADHVDDQYFLMSPTKG